VGWCLTDPIFITFSVFSQADSFDAPKLKEYWKIMSVLTFFTSVMGIIRGTMRLGWDDDGGMGDVISALISAGLGFWMISAVKILGERIEKGEISPQDPSGHAMQVPGGVQLTPVAVAVAAVPVSAQPAIAVAVVPEKMV
jgi:hypothetical protein